MPDLRQFITSVLNRLMPRHAYPLRWWPLASNISLCSRRQLRETTHFAHDSSILDIDGTIDCYSTGRTSPQQCRFPNSSRRILHSWRIPLQNPKRTPHNFLLRYARTKRRWFSVKPLGVSRSHSWQRRTILPVTRACSSTRVHATLRAAEASRKLAAESSRRPIARAGTPCLRETIPDGFLSMVMEYQRADLPSGSRISIPSRARLAPPRCLLGIPRSMADDMP